MLKGKLQVKENKGQKPVVMLILPTKNGGKSSYLIPENAKYFKDTDAVDGLEVDVETDTRNNIIKVSIPGKEPFLQHKYNEMKTGQNNNRENKYADNYRKSPDTNKLSQGDPSLIGFSFHNPYTFIPFTKNTKRDKPTLQTADEIDADRFTGIIELKITTQSPLLTIQTEKNKQEEHAKYKALTIGNDVIVPATSIRGSLRYLLTVVTGGPLTILDEQLYLCQGRDLPMDIDPAHSRNPKAKPCCLAKIIESGNSRKSGKIQVGQTVMVLAKDIPDCDFYRPQDRKNIEYRWVNYDGTRVVSVSGKQDATHRWQVKLCGRPANTKGVKKEGIFLANGKEIDLPVKFWQAYANRNRHGARPELQNNDLIWLELKDHNVSVPRTENDIASIQWARWGREGKQLIKILSDNVLPDYQKSDGNVANVTDMFGLVPVSKNNSKVPAFAGRIRPDNLVFPDGKEHLTPMYPLAVLASPHSGCLPFYRAGSPQTLNRQDSLRGYKIYRTSEHTSPDDKEAPWKFENQGVYDKSGKVEDGGTTKVNFSAELLNPDVTGTVRLSVRSLSRKELSLLILVCNNNTWRLGGGKPLGLGQCEVQIIRILDELGNEILQQNMQLETLEPETINRFNLWKATQKPVKMLRYPRAVIKNQNRITRGGLSWFQKFASPKRNGNGLQSIFIEKNEFFGQILPFFNEDGDDVLFGYDTMLDDNDRENIGQQKSYRHKPEQFDPNKHVTGQEQSGGFHGQNREIRQKAKDYRQ
ncbi:MAG: RAMP superfamily CRISPR-associated protein [Planctomycetaceae bacterium]|jgi:CRISPR-associated protein (TIGR03986 family)|nr:RAMP superfamily CRISPR-associated protein [Planctomycetaceae bacterium]